MNIFVGNLSFEAKEIDVQRVFTAFGLVTSVAIVMEKKGKKSRGFGFVEMPDEQEALAAIAQLQGKEILGRPINVLPALSKEPKTPPAHKQDRYLAQATDDHQEGSPAGYKRSNPRHDPSFKRTGKYKEGRRTISYLKKRIESGITAPVPERRYKSNPMRWRKKTSGQAPFVKPEGGLKPWQRPQTESNPWKKPRPGSWRKTESELKPWEKNRGRPKPWNKSENSEAKPWQRAEGVSRPWKKTESEPRPWERGRGSSKPWIKTESSSLKPWKKTENAGAAKPWKKDASKLKPWRKSSADRQQSGFKKRSKFSKPHRA